MPLHHLPYQFKNKQLLEQALLHPSKGGKHFQRLEFLGDRVLSLSLALILMKADESEGVMAKKLAKLASAQILKEVALSWKLDQLLMCTSHQTDSILADACEAVLGAIYTDCNDINLIKNIVEVFWGQILERLDYIDSKTDLQEQSHKLYGCAPSYKVRKISGQDHNPLFEASVTVGGGADGKPCAATATGSSKKEAEKNAACVLLGLLKN